MIIILVSVAILCVLSIIFTLLLVESKRLKREILFLSGVILFISVIIFCDVLYKNSSTSFEQTRIDLNREYSQLLLGVENQDNLTELEKIKLNYSVMLYNKKVVEYKYTEKNDIFNNFVTSTYFDSKLIEFSYIYPNKELKNISNEESYAHFSILASWGNLFIMFGLSIFMFWFIIFGMFSVNETEKKLEIPFVSLIISILIIVIGMVCLLSTLSNTDNKKITKVQIENQYMYDIYTYKANNYNDLSEMDKINCIAEIESFNLKINEKFFGLGGFKLYPIKISK